MRFFKTSSTIRIFWGVVSFRGSDKAEPMFFRGIPGCFVMCCVLMSACMAEPTPTANDAAPGIRIEGLRGIRLDVPDGQRFKARSAVVEGDAWRFSEPGFETGQELQASADRAAFRDGRWTMEGGIQARMRKGYLRAERLDAIENTHVTLWNVHYENDTLRLDADRGEWNGETDELRLHRVRVESVDRTLWEAR